MHFNARCLIGLAGVHPQEHATAVRMGEFFKWPLIMVAIWLPLEWFLEVKGQMSREVIIQTDWIEKQLREIRNGNARYERRS